MTSHNYFWVMEWLHKESGEWFAIEGNSTLKQLRWKMRFERLKANGHDNPRTGTEKFRIKKYERVEP